MYLLEFVYDIKSRVKNLWMEPVSDFLESPGDVLYFEPEAFDFSPLEWVPRFCNFPMIQRTLDNPIKYKVSRKPAYFS